MSLLDKIGLQDKLNPDDLYNTFVGLERPQKIMVGVGIGLVLIAMMVFPVSCINSALGEKEDDYQKHLKMADEFHKVLNEYKSLQGGFDALKNKSRQIGKDPLKGVIYQATDDLNIDRQKVTPKTVSPVAGELFTELAKDVTIQNIRFDQTIKLLDKLVHHKGVPVAIKKLSIKVDPKQKQNMKSLSFRVSTMKPNK